MKNELMEQRKMEAAEDGGSTKATKKKSAKKKSAKKSAKKKSAKKERVPREQSKSGKYVSIRHLMETLFAKNQDLEKDAAIAAVKKEFPKAAFLANPGSHFGWYKSHIVSHGEYKHVEKPKGKVKAVAKIKK